MCVTEIPQLLYYAYLPAMLLSIFFSVFIYLQNRKNVLNILLMLIGIVFSAWIALGFISWFPWSYENYMLIQKFLLVILIVLPLFIYFAYNVVGFLISRITHILIWIPVFPILILNFSYYNNLIYTLDSSCFVHEGFLYPYIYFLAFLYLAWFIWILIKKYTKNETEDIIKKQIKITLFALAVLILWTVLFMKLEVFLGEDILIFSPFGMVIFIGILAYGITKYHILKIKLLAAQALVLSLIFLVGSQFFFAQDLTSNVLTAITLFLVGGVGIILIRSVKKEVERKEELQKMADALASANDELRKLDNAKSEFISIASHQLRTPLTAIKGFVSLILEDTYGEITPQVRGALNKVYASGEHLIQLVEELLNVSRIESGRMQFIMAEADIGSLIKDLYENFLLVAKTRGLYLEMKMPRTKLPKILMDQSKVREVVSNLIDNALKYSEKGGVTIKAEVIKKGMQPLPKSKNTASSQKEQEIDGDVVRVTVSDTGVGIPATEMSYLFKKFSRGKDVMRLHVGGTGLGIYVAKNIIEAHKGRIWVESEGSGKGARFIIELPLIS